MDPSRVPDAPDVLDGWKDIASYLGRSVRSVQRWERDLGLPIHRIPTPDGGTIIYALRSELDAWRTRQSERPPGETGGASSPPPQPEHNEPIPSVSPEPTRAAVARVAASPPGWLRRWLSARVPAWTLPMAAGAMLAAILMAGSTVSPAGAPATWEFEGRQLRASTEGGRLLWTHAFGRVVSRPTTARVVGGVRVDIDNDGVDEAVVPVRFSAPRARPLETDAVFAFRANGSEIWSVQPAVTLRWGDEVFSGPWHVYDIATGMTPSGPRTWIAYSHHTWWPAFVVEVNPDGEQFLRYVQPGRIFTITYWPTTSGHLLVAGGTLNEASSASLALVNLDGPPARWSGKTAPPSCSGCPAYDPAGMFLLPTSDVTKALHRPYGWVMRSRVLNSGVELVTNAGFGWGSIVTLSQDLQVTSFARADQYWQVHQELESEGRISHPAAECPDVRQPLEVQRWVPTAGWSTLSVPLRVALPTADAAP